MTQGPAAYPKKRVVAAWGVHFYTALGLPLMFFSALELLHNYGRVDKSPVMFFLLNIIAVAVDATDGFMARKVKVKEVLPDFSGHRLDNLVDFLSFAFLPSLALVAFGLLPENYEFIAILPIMASGYGFCQEAAKTEDAFVGFPSYWNIVLLYFFVLGSSPWVNVGVLLFLSFMVFVPIHYLYPSRTKFMMAPTLILGVIWTGMIVAISLYPQASWAKKLAWISFFYPIYYTVVSLIHHRRVHAEPAPEESSVELPEQERALS